MGEFADDFAATDAPGPLRRGRGPRGDQDRNRPLPSPGPGQVLIKVAAAGINRPDCVQRAGHYPPPPGASEIPGLEIAGTIVALGEGVAPGEIGREVCALVISGGYAEYCVAELPLCLPIPKRLSLIEASGLPENYYTVYDNVFTRGRLKKGESFLVHGGSSGIGSTAIQLAKAFGATVYATAGSDEKCDFCRGIGADVAINYRNADFVAQIRRHTDKRGVDVILDMVGGPYIARNLGLLALEGRLVQIAFLQPSVASIDFMPLMLKRLTLTGSTLRARSVALKAEIAEKLRSEVWPLLDAGRIRPCIDTVYPLEQARESHAHMEASTHSGKIIPGDAAMSLPTHAGEVVLVTGAGRGIGRAIADAHAEAGAAVLYLDFDPALSTAAAEAACARGWKAKALAADVADPDALHAALAAGMAAFGPVTALVNNAGISPKSGAGGGKAPIWEMGAAEWGKVLEVNLSGAFHGIKAVLPGMMAARRGTIVSLSSVAGKTYCDIVGVHYAATKAAIIGMTRHLAGELGPHGITVNAIAPGRIDTPLMRGTASAANAAVKAITPLGRFGTPEEVAATALFLTSGAARFITAQVIDVAGGWLMT